MPPRAHFVGNQTIATVDQVDAWMRSAAKGARFVYCAAPDLIRCETSAHVTELERQGLVVPLLEKREGGGFNFLIQRTGKAEAAKDPRGQALADYATRRILRELEHAARKGEECPSDAELMRRCGLNTRNEAQWRVRKLVTVGLIESVQVYEGGVPRRVVTILASGKHTAFPPSWAARLGGSPHPNQPGERASVEGPVDDLRRGGGL